LTFDLESGVRVTCDVGYPCANFGLHRPLELGPMYGTDKRHTKAWLNDRDIILATREDNSAIATAMADVNKVQCRKANSGRVHRASD